jgi:hypothetical protein
LARRGGAKVLAAPGQKFRWRGWSGVVAGRCRVEDHIGGLEVRRAWSEDVHCA